MPQRHERLQECNKDIHSCAQTSNWRGAIVLLKKAAAYADLVTFNSAINACGKAACWQHALSLLNQLGVRRLQPSHISYNTSIDACARASRWEEAVHLSRLTLGSHSIADSALFALNTALSACARSATWRMAIHMLKQIRTQLLEPDEVSFKWLLSAFERAQFWEKAMNMVTENGLSELPYSAARTDHWPAVLRVLSQQRSRRLQVATVSLSSTTSALAESMEWQDALHFLQSFVRTEVLLSTATMVSWGQGFQWQEAITFLHRLSKENADAYTISAAILACSQAKAWHAVLTLLQQANAMMIPLNVVTYGAAVFSCESKWEAALQVLQDMTYKAIEANVVVYNSAMSSCASSGRWRIIGQILEEMEGAHMLLDVVSLSSLMHACVMGKEWRLALHVLQSFPGRSLQATEVTFGTAISACEDEGQWPLAFHFLQEQREAKLRLSVIHFNSAISACEKGLAWEQGMEALRAVLEHSLQADLVTHSSSIRLCEHADQWEETLQFLRTMQGAEVHSNQAKLDAARACAACGQQEIAMVLAMQMCGPVGPLWCLSQIYGSDPWHLSAALLPVLRLEGLLNMQETLQLCSASLVLGIDCKPLSKRLEKSVRRVLPQMSLQQLQVAAALGWTSATILPAIQECCLARLKTGDVGVFEEAAESVLGVLWVSRVLNCTSRRMVAIVRSWLKIAAAPVPRELPLRRRPLPLERSELIIQDLPDRAVLLKPPGWDVYDQCVEEKQLCNIASDAFGPWPIFSDSKHRRGFLHRLDVPSSGLVVVAKTFEAFYDLQVQLCTDMSRRYVAMAHGWLRPRCHEASLFWWGNGPTVAGGRGKASCTKVMATLPLIHFTTMMAFSLVHLEILTGRRHQIRSHLSHSGHPTVSDGLYASATVYKADLNISPRNWLHRYALSFYDRHGRVIKPQAPLPSDLQEALQQMTFLKSSGSEVDKWFQDL
ncbi:unnamed protein product [Durusdinium trenchii]|uniref:Pseudouridine synthase RsuA/RluA-like domain-containing protein n=2 Tax=Durusdinium trenchii TaxID=1381693 RepID=A0ABP0M206_9DINO